MHVPVAKENLMLREKKKSFLEGDVPIFCLSYYFLNSVFTHTVA